MDPGTSLGLRQHPDKVERGGGGGGGGGGGALDLDDDDSPGPNIWALLAGGALQAGLGCEGAGGVGPTLV